MKTSIQMFAAVVLAAAALQAGDATAAQSGVTIAPAVMQRNLGSAAGSTVRYADYTPSDTPVTVQNVHLRRGYYGGGYVGGYYGGYRGGYYARPYAAYRPYYGGYAYRPYYGGYYGGYAYRPYVPYYRPYYYGTGYAPYYSFYGGPVYGGYYYW